MSAEGRSRIRKLLVGGLLLAVAVQLGVFFALRQKKKKESDKTSATASLVTEDRRDAAPAPEPTPPSVIDAGFVPERPVDAALAAPDAAPAREETRAERRRRERLEAREEARRERQEKRRAAEEERRLAKQREQEAKREREEKRRLEEAARAAERVPAKAEPIGLVSFAVTPKGATLAVDGVFVGKAPLRSVKTAAGTHTLAASAPGFAADTVRFTVTASERKTVRLALDAKPAAAGVSDVGKRPATPRVSGLGDPGRGRRLIGFKCNACHRARGVGSVSPRSRRRGAWERFFARGYHDRYERLGGLVSSGSMAAIKAYLMENAKCDSNSAGEKCK